MFEVAGVNQSICSSNYEGVDYWDAVRRFIADATDKHCYRAALTVTWSLLAFCMQEEGLLLESGFVDVSPGMYAALEEDERPQEHAALMVEMHAIRCLSVTEVIDCGAAPEAPMLDSENQRAAAVEALHKEYRAAVGDAEEEATCAATDGMDSAVLSRKH